MHRILAVGLYQHLGTSLQRLLPDDADDMSVRETTNLDHALDILAKGESIQLIIACLSSHDLQALANIQRLREQYHETQILTLFDVGANLSDSQATVRQLLASFHSPRPVTIETHTRPRAHAPLRHLPAWPGEEPTGHALTARQIEVLQLVREGKSNKQIARLLDLSEGTIKVHCMAIFRALGVTNRTQAAIAAESRPLA